jgi:hypothetical protein
MTALPKHAMLLPIRSHEGAPAMSTDRLVVAMLILASVAGCARWRERPAHDPLDAWTGKKERQLVLAAGAPDAVHDLKDGGRILTWHRSYTERQGGETTTVTETRTVNGQTVLVPVTRQEPSFDFHYECTTSFEIDKDGIVRGHGTHGNDCGNFLKSFE